MAINTLATATLFMTQLDLGQNKIQGFRGRVIVLFF